MLTFSNNSDCEYMIVKGIVKMYQMIQITPHQQKSQRVNTKKLYHPLQKGPSGGNRPSL